jgi:Domain of unknown function (DUF4116)
MPTSRPRLEKILTLYGQALIEAVGQRESNNFNDLISSRGEGTKCATSQRLEVKTATSLEVAEREARLSEKDLLHYFADFDPTFGKSRTQWLVKTYIQDDKFKLEDLGRATAALSAFERFKRKLSFEQREISCLMSLRALEALVEPFVKAESKARLERDLSSATGRELRRLEEWKARDESIIIQESEGLPTIVVPMTEFAACWWGRGTKWCTAAEKNNAFTQYHKDTPLIVLVCSNGEKFQVYVTNKDIQFMDATDRKVDEETIREKWNDLHPLISWIMLQNWKILLHPLPEDMITQEFWDVAVKQDGYALSYVPDEHRTSELCRLAVEQNGWALQFVPDHQKTPELCYIAIQQNGRALQYVLNNQKTPKLCSLAVQQCGEAIEYVPEEKRTLEICRVSVEQDGRALQYVPVNQQTPELCCLAVKQNWRALEYIPLECILFNLKSNYCENYISKLGHLAVEQNGLTLRHVPERYRTPELCRIAVEQNGRALEYVPDNYKTLELCRLAVQGNGTALEFVPEKRQNLGFWRWWKRYFAPTQGYRSPKLCCLAVKQSGWALCYIPKEYKNYELYRLAIEQNGDVLQCIHEDQRIPSLCRLAVEQNGMALQYVPENAKTPELCRLAVEQNGRALYYVPVNKMTTKLYHFAVEQDGMALRLVPEDQRTLEICCLAIEQNKDSLYYVPEKYRTPELLALISPTQPIWNSDILDKLCCHFSSQFCWKPSP